MAVGSVQRLRDRLHAGGPLFSAWCGFPEPTVAGWLARDGRIDAVVLDLQHGAYDLAAAARAIPLVAAAGKPCIARIPIGEFGTAARLCDAGASAIIAPMVNTAADARLFAAHVKYPPLGERSWGPGGALGLTGMTPPAYFAEANGFTLAFAMIETREALDRIDAILEVYGIDGIFIGPFDLSIGLSRGAAVDPDGPEVEAAIDHARARASAAGKYAGIYAATGERAADYGRRGYDLVAVGSDATFLQAGAAAALDAAGR